MEIFNSEIAGVLGGYSAITLGFISLYKRDKNKVSETTRVHESIHRQQWPVGSSILVPKCSRTRGRKYKGKKARLGHDDVLNAKR